MNIIGIIIIVISIAFFVLIFILMRKTGRIRTGKEDSKIFNLLATISNGNYLEADSINLQDKVNALFANNNNYIEPIKNIVYKNGLNNKTYFCLINTKLPQPHTKWVSPKFHLCLQENSKQDNFELLIIPHKFLLTGELMIKYYEFVKNLTKVELPTNSNLLKDYEIYSNDNFKAIDLIKEDLINSLKNANISNLVFHRKGNLVAVYTTNHIDDPKDYIELEKINNQIINFINN